jgi:hypothetical protein
MRTRVVHLAAALGLILAAGQGCTSASSSQADNARSDLSDTDADTTGVKGSETYGEYDQRRDDLDGSAGDYADFGCTQDCSGHDAGYQWAQDHGVTDESECGGKSWSFEEGCVAYAQEQSDDESQDGDESYDSDDSY